MTPVWIAAAVVFLEVLSFGAMFPVMPDYCRDLGGLTTDAQVAWWAGLMFAAVGGPRIIMNTVWGRLSDRIGRRRVLAIATCGTLGGSVLWALAEALGESPSSALAWLAVSRLLAGFFQAQAALTAAVAADATTPQQRAGAMGILGVGFGLGMLGGIALGGAVGHLASPAAVGWAAAAAQLLSVLVILFALPETHPAHVAGAERTPDYFRPQHPLQLARRPDVRHLLVVTLIMTAGHMVLVPTLRVVSDAWFNLDLLETTWLFAAWMGVGILVQGGAIRPLVKRFGERSVTAAGTAVLAAGLFLMAASSSSLPAFWTAAMIVALGGALAAPTLTSMLSHTVGPQEQGSVQGLNQSLTAAGRTLSYFLAGGLYRLVSDTAPFWLGGSLVTVALLALLARPPAKSIPVAASPPSA